jgi:glycosyltransferase involved in cell wall biosynthesis
MKILVIVPAYNEEKNLPQLLRKLSRYCPTADVCVVDDSSRDDTAKIASEHGALVLRLPCNLGIGGAVQTGYLWAKEHNYDVAVQIDGDGQHDPCSLEAVIEPITKDEADLVVGSRFLLEGNFRSTTVRRIGIRYLRWFLKTRCKISVTDPTSGYRAANRQAIHFFANYYPSDFPEPETIALCQRQGLRVREVAVRMEIRRHGKSSINLFRSILYFLKLTAALLLLPSCSALGYKPRDAK